MEDKIVVYNCVFCALPCALTFSRELNGEVIRSHHENEADKGGDSDSSCPSLSFFLEEEQVPKLGKQLKILFIILRDILQIPEEKLMNHLTKLEGSFHPGFGIKVCKPCGDSVSEYYRLLKVVLKLQTKLHLISSKLKDKIWNTIREQETDLASGGDDNDYDDVDDDVGENNEEAISGVWRDVREHAVTAGDLEQQPPDLMKPDDVDAPLLGAYDLDSDEVDIPGTTDQDADTGSEVSSEGAHQFHHTEQGRDLENEATQDPVNDGNNEYTQTKPELEVEGAPPTASSASKDARVFVNAREVNEENRMVDSAVKPHARRSQRNRRPPKNREFFNTLSAHRSRKNRPSQDPELPKTRKVRKRSLKKTKYICDECGYSRETRELLLRHMELHKPNGPPSTLCPHCGWRIRSDKLGLHIGTRHTRQISSSKKTTPTVRRSYKKCKECGSLFHDWTRLENHMKLHLSGRGHVCDICKWLCHSLAQHKGTWHPTEKSKLAEIQKRIADRSVVTQAKLRAKIVSLTDSS